MCNIFKGRQLTSCDLKGQRYHQLFDIAQIDKWELKFLNIAGQMSCDVIILMTFLGYPAM